MNFEFTVTQVLTFIILIAVAIVALIFILKYILNNQKDLKAKYENKDKSSLLVARNKYPEVDSFKLRNSVLLTGLVMSLATIFFAFNWTTYEKKMDLSGYDLEVEEDFEMAPPPTKEPPPPPPPPPPPVIEAVPDNQIIDEEDQPTFANQEVTVETQVTAPPVDTTRKAPPPPPPPPPEDKEEIFVMAEDMPRFPGCEDKGTKAEKEECAGKKLMEYIYSNLKYPPIATENGIEGRVTIRFVVDRDGKVGQVEILRDIGGGCGEAAKKVIEGMNNMPDRWLPGRQGGRKVKVYFTLPVIFKLSG
ncbi:MAG: energy transducer TonB [Deltaproteobacteria bacterium]